jgi:hypothetical protein
VRRAIVTTVIASALFASSGARAQEVEQDAPAEETKPQRERAGVLVAGGASYRALFGLPVETGVVGAGVGVESGHLAVYARGEYERGNVDRGLALHVVRIGGSMEGIVGAFRIGAGLSLSNVSIARATDGTTIDRFGVGIFGITSLDLVRFDDHALYLGARFDGDASAHMVGASLVLGFRL